MVHWYGPAARQSGEPREEKSTLVNAVGGRRVRDSMRPAEHPVLPSSTVGAQRVRAAACRRS